MEIGSGSGERFAPSSAYRSSGPDGARCRAPPALPWRSPALQGLRPPVAPSWFSAPPCVVSTTVGYSLRPAPRPAEAFRGALSCAWPAFEASNRESPSRARRRGAGAPGFSSPTTLTSTANPVPRGVPPPRTFRPQGLSTLSTAFPSPCPAAARRPPRRPWGSPFRALLLPASATPLGVSPLLSFTGMT